VDQASEESLRRRSSSESQQGSPQGEHKPRETLGQSDGGRRKRSYDLKDSIDCAKEGVSGRKSPVDVLSGGSKGLQGMPKVGYTLGAGGIARSRPEAGSTIVHG
jgi:hypothetical protein